MVVVVEYALIDNFVIDLFIIKCVYFIKKIPMAKKRVFITCLIASVMALLFPLVKGKGTGALLKILMGLFITSIMENHKSFKSYYISTLLFFLLTFLFGGAVYAIYGIFEIEKTDFSVGLAVLPVLIIYKAVKEFSLYLYQKKQTAKFSYQVELFFSEKSVKAEGFLDSGNTACYKNFPIIFINEKLFKDLGINGEKGAGYVEINTVNQTELKQVYLIDGIKIYFDNPIVFNGVCVCKAKQDTVILNSKFIGENYEYSKTDKSAC